MKINWNYLIGSDGKIDKNYNIQNRPDPDNVCKKLYDDFIEVYFQHGFIFGSNFEIENKENQYKYDPKFDLEKQWENYEKVNDIMKPQDKNKKLQPPFYTIKVNERLKGKEWLLSIDYIGPSIYWALRESETGGLSKEDIIETLNVCRTIGGHIVWARGSDLVYKINQERGGEKSVYDRIDWTLYLVQLCYKYDFDIAKVEVIVKQTYPKGIFDRISKLIGAICESKSWFNEFGSFNEFCDQFILNGSFVDENYEVKWFAKILPIFPENYRQFSLNNTNAVKQRNLNILVAKYTHIIDELFCDGGETYLLRDLKCKFENEGIVDENFNDALEECLLQGWIIDCGNGIYTH